MELKRTIQILLLAMMLSSCLRENQEGCYADMRLSFYLEDSYQSGDFDSRVGNDVLLYIFQNKILTHSQMIPYQEIAVGREYAIRKTDKIQGALQFVAWSVPVGTDMTLLPSFPLGANLDDQFIKLGSTTRAIESGLPFSTELYMGLLSSVEAADKETIHKIGIHSSACRVEVNVTDLSESLSVQDPKVKVYGSMTRMDMGLNGVGNQAIVGAELRCPSSDLQDLTTGRFGILPSSEGQNISAEIFNGDIKLATLTVPSDNLPKGAQSGGLIIFDYVLGDPEFRITVDGFTQKIIVIDEM